MPFFPKPDGDMDTWLLGNSLLREYYTVFDYENINDDTSDYLKIGIAPLNKSNDIF